MMRDEISSVTATYVKSHVKDGSVDWAGKTGTSKEHKDAWFVGVNPNVTFSTWTGYDTSPDIRRGYQHPNMTHSERVIKLWSELINGAAEVEPDLVTPHENLDRKSTRLNSSHVAIS